MSRGQLTNILIGLVLAGVVLAAVTCSSSASSSAPAGADSDATATPSAAGAATASPASTPAVTPPPGAATVEPDPMGEDPFKLGERIFLTEAGEGIGCSFCHGLDGRGSAAIGSPPIRGKFAWEIQMALDNNPVMDFLSLNPEEVAAVSTYLEWLATQP